MEERLHCQSWLWLVMKLSVYKLLLVALLSNVVYAHRADGQDIMERVVSIHVEKTDIRKVVNILEKTTGISFVYSSKAIGATRKISIHATDQKLSQVLESVFKPLHISYRIVDGVILLQRQVIDTPPAVDSPARSLETGGLSMVDRNLTGTVTDEKGEGLPGVSIVVKSTRRGTTSDGNGQYKLPVPEGAVTLVFSFVGYVSQEVAVGNKTVLNVTLLNDEKSLNEVVVVGYGTQVRKDITGAIGKVEVKDLQRAPVASFEEALGGRVAGVQVTGQDGQPGGEINIVIRGNGSVTQDNSPLYIIDGFPIENPRNNQINPAEIESMEVLKDASATAIYGARGANGVIIITTKKGKEGPTQVDYDVNYGIQDITKKLSLLSAYDFVKFQLEASPTQATTTYLSNDRTLESYREVKGVDLQDVVFGNNVPMKNHNLRLSGGNTRTRFSLSGSIFNQDGLIINSGFNRYQSRFTIDNTISDKLKFSANVSYSRTKGFGTIAASSLRPGVNTNTGALMHSIWAYRPVTGGQDNFLDDLYDPEQDLTSQNNIFINPAVQLQNQLREDINSNITANAFAEYKLLKNLTLKVSGGLNNNLARSNAFNNSNTSQGNALTSPSTLVNGSVRYTEVASWLNENTLTYNLITKSGHKLNVLGGITYQAGRSSFHGYSAIQVPNESLGISGLDEGTPQTIAAGESNWTLASYLSRVNYSYKGKYLVTASYRADGSSKFPSNNRWAYFPSGSVAWQFGEEKFIKENLGFLSEGKIRASWGKTGNNRVGDFAYLPVISFPLSRYYSINNNTPTQGANLNTPGNDKLRWETTAQTDVGLDLSFFKKRLHVSVDLYRKVTSDLLLNAQVPLSQGYFSLFKNVGKVQNEGLEFSVDGDIVKVKDFTWSANFNISFNRNKVLALTENQESILSQPAFGGYFNNLATSIGKIGQPISMFYGYIWDGVYQLDDFIRLGSGAYILKNGITASSTNRAASPGFPKYVDINGDGLTNALDFTVIGNPNPKHIGGFTNNFQYKGLDLSVFFQWSYGNDILNINRQIFEGGSGRAVGFNQFASYADRWTPTNPTNDIPGYSVSPTLQNYSGRIVEDGSYLRLKTVQIGYNLPTKWLKRAKIRNIRLYASGQNLYTWTKYKGYDPEVSVNYSPLTLGLDYSAYPRVRTMTVGMNIQF